MRKKATANTGAASSPEIVTFYCSFRTNMSEWNGEGEPYLSEYEGELFVNLDDDVDEPHLAGRARLFILNADAAENDDENGPSLFELLDVRGETAAYLPLLHSTEAGNFSPAVCSIVREDMALSQNMLILDRLEILPEFRGQQLGLRYMRIAIKRFGLGCRIVAIKPFPLQLEPERTHRDSDLDWYTRMNMKSLSRGTREATSKLKRYYGREGFVPVKGTDLMILDLYQHGTP
jgi:hypothetical protein